MSAPQLIPSARQFHLPTNATDVRSFEVRQRGCMGEQVFNTGEHLLLDGAPCDGDLVVLTARGPGRPRLGRVSGSGLVGDRGEPCSHTRWAVAGRVVGVARPLAGGWSVQHFDSPTVFGIQPVRRVVREPAPKVALGQLSLFAA